MYHSTYAFTFCLSSDSIFIPNRPGVLRCLMGYIVDLTIVLEVLFWFKVAQPRHKSICEEDITAAFGLYQGSPEHLKVHQQIRSYVDDMTPIDQANPQDNT